MFNHERLIVYQESLAFASRAAVLVETWDRKHAVSDHLARAAESIALNLAEACRADSIKIRHAAMDYSLGSLFECAACLDVARVKALVDSETELKEKKQLLAMCGKLIGLRKSWEARCMHDEQAEYTIEAPMDNVCFSHERLVVYKSALAVIENLKILDPGTVTDKRLFQDIDETSTSVVLNLAEGNGRFAELDHRRFLGIANRATVRLAVLLDLGAVKKRWPSQNVQTLKNLLERVSHMTTAMMRRCERNDKG